MERGEGERGDGERWLESAAAPVQFDYNICRRPPTHPTLLVGFGGWGKTIFG